MVFLLFGGATLLAVVDCLHFLINGKRIMGYITLGLVEIISIVVGPLIFLSFFDIGKINDCCADSAFFAPSHRLTIYVLILLSAGAYFYSSWRKALAPPLLELLVNCFLLIGLVLNVFIFIQIMEPLFWVLGNTSILALFLTVILKNHQKLLTEADSMTDRTGNFVERAGRRILRANIFIKFPLLLLLCLPFLMLIAVVLFVFGQQPDSAIKAFTETYKHGLSELDYMCDNVQCGGHYLCSVAANGHRHVVKPQRYGKEMGG